MLPSKDENTEENKDEQESWKIGFSRIDMENPYFSHTGKCNQRRIGWEEL